MQGSPEEPLPATRYSERTNKVSHAARAVGWSQARTALGAGASTTAVDKMDAD